MFKSDYTRRGDLLTVAVCPGDGAMTTCVPETTQPQLRPGEDVVDSGARAGRRYGRGDILTVAVCPGDGAMDVVDSGASAQVAGMGEVSAVRCASRMFDASR